MSGLDVEDPVSAGKPLLQNSSMRMQHESLHGPICSAAGEPCRLDNDEDQASKKIRLCIEEAAHADGCV